MSTKSRATRKANFSLNRNDAQLDELVAYADHQTLARWAVVCAERALPLFEARFPEDARPRTAITTLQTWIATGRFSMAVIRKASLDAHAAAREVGDDSPARSAARACGQAVATAHVRTHAPGAAIYGQQAVYRNGGDVTAERDWQYARLVELVDAASRGR